ncbi:MAG: hypothetical protein AB7S26_42965 [Sandaracinaceae bacterium]
MGWLVSWIRDALVVARFDLAESLRSRKALVFLVLYVAGAVAATWMFTEVLQEVEEQLAQQLLVARTDTPGSLTQAVMESPELHAVLARLVRDDELATQLLALPPIALVYHWVALTFAPAFVALTSSDAIALEVASGSARFALFRTDKSAWATGKLLGQASLSVVGVGLGAVGAWITGWIQLASFEPGASALWMLRYSGTAFLYVFAFLGIVMATSQLTRSVQWSRALGLLALVGTFTASGWLGRDSVRESAPALVDSLRLLFPAAHKLDLWRLEWTEVAPAGLVLVAMGLGAFTVAHLVFLRRDA